jgi:uncharacterized DUF497 family protein
LTKIARRIIMEYKFEWDEEKNALNWMKHGILFEEAKMVFHDPRRVDIYDREHSLFEDRWNTIGLYNCDIFSVIYTMRKGIIRIISARKADKKEKEAYFYGYGKGNINWR